MRRNSLYMCGIIVFTSRSWSRPRFAGKTIDQIREFHQIGEPHKRPSIAHDHFRIRTDKISPLRGKRPNGGIVGLQQKAFAMSVVAPADTWQLPCE